VRNILIAVPGKKEKLPLSVTHPELAKTLIEPEPHNVTMGSHKIGTWKCKNDHIYEMSIRGRVKATDCPICTGNRILPGYNDLQTTHPEISALADGWDPESVSAGSNKMKNWKCQRQHSWSAPVYSLTQGTRCPTCAGQQLQQGFNDLATTHPLIGAQALGWDPTTVNASNKEKRKWKCPEGHYFEASILNRAYKGDGCGVCSGRQVLRGFNDLQTSHPEVAAEAFGWDPTNVVAGSNKLQKWRCSQGHLWRAKPNSRTSSAKTGCPTCANSGFDPNDLGYLYFLNHPNWEMFQIGITNDPDTRIGQHKKLGWELLELRGPMDGGLTRQWETAILRMLKAKGADLSNEKIAGKFDGYSEAWSKSTFEVASIKELMRLTEEFEEEK
jgi:Probable Zinc-ribbon domain